VRDDRKTFRRAIGVSLVLHVLLLFLAVPRMREAWSSSAAPIFAVTPQQETAQRPIEFEFVDLAEEREETPDDPNAPMSDLDRRAHGGEGEAADRPASRGNTPQLVQAEGGQVFNRGAPPQVPGPPAQQVPQPRPEEQPEERPRQDEPAERRPEGAGRDPEDPADAAQQQPAVPLPPPGVWALPPSEGGLSENPDRQGGFVDTGAVSFDTQWYDWGPYAKSMLAKVRRHWQIPQIARLGVSGIVRVRFSIERDGTITGVQIIDESGRPPMDFAARDAIIDCINFEPLPAGLGLNGPEGVTITFLYNVASRDRGR
jgi:TonB family protein